MIPMAEILAELSRELRVAVQNLQCLAGQSIPCKGFIGVLFPGTNQRRCERRLPPMCFRYGYGMIKRLSTRDVLHEAYS